MKGVIYRWRWRYDDSPDRRYAGSPSLLRKEGVSYFYFYFLTFQSPPNLLNFNFLILNLNCIFAPQLTKIINALVLFK